jgi:peroxiredoxin family protein/TusA-related sulfurtransferase
MPGPLLKVKETLAKLAPGDTVAVTATDPGFAADIPKWCQSTGNTLLDVTPDKGKYVARIVKGGADCTTAATSAVEKTGKTIVCFSNDLDKVLATFVIANGAAAMGHAVTIFFTFWGLNVLRRDNPPAVRKGLLDRMFCAMMPRGPEKLVLSKMNMAGMGTKMMKYVMRSKHVLSLPELIQTARDGGVKLVACLMSMDIMGVAKEELMDGVAIGGVGYYLGEAGESNVNLFI